MRLAKIAEAYRASPAAILRFVGGCLEGCKECLCVYESLECDHDLKKALVMHNFRPAKICDWSVLRDREILERFLAFEDDREACCGFKGFFTVLFGSRPVSGISLDLSGVGYTAKEMHFFLEQADAPTSGAAVRRKTGSLEEDVRYLAALKMYLLDSNSLVSDGFVSVIVGVHDCHKAAAEPEKFSEYHALLFGCVHALVRRKRQFSRLFEGFFRETVLSGGVLRSAEVLDFIDLFRGSHLLQLFYNNLDRFDERLIFQLLSDTQRLDICDLVRSNGSIDALLCSLSKSTVQFGCTELHTAEFVRKIVFAKLKLFQNDGDRLRTPIGDSDWCEMGAHAYAILYLEIFLGLETRVCRLSCGPVCILRSLAGCRGAEDATYTEEDLITVMEDIREIGALGYEILSVLERFTAFFSLGPLATARLYDLFGRLMAERQPGSGEKTLSPHLSHAEGSRCRGGGREEVARSSPKKRMVCVSLRSGKANAGLSRKNGRVDGSPCDTSPADVEPVKAYKHEDSSTCGASDPGVITLGRHPSHTGSEKQNPSLRQPRDAAMARSQMDLSCLPSTEMGAAGRNIANTLGDDPQSHADPVARKSASKHLEMEKDGGGMTESSAGATNSTGATILESLERIRKNATAIVNDAQERESVLIENTHELANTTLFSRKEGRALDIARNLPMDGTSTLSAGHAADRQEDSELDPSFFDVFLSLYGRLGRGLSQIPQEFQSYDEYFTVFNLLRVHEVRSSVRTSIRNSNAYGMCEVWDVCNGVEIRAERFPFSEHDLLFFSDSVDRADEGIDRVVGAMDSGEENRALDVEAPGAARGVAFVGLVGEVHHKKTASETGLQTLVRVVTGRRSELPKRGDTLYYRHIENTMTALREFHALQSVKDSQVLRYILKPREKNAVERPRAEPVQREKRWAENTADSKITNLYLASRDEAEKGRDIAKITRNLNKAQADTVSKCFLSREKFFLIQGPPGTGKTMVILSIIQALLGGTHDRLLICTPSNTAIDEIVFRLAASKDAYPPFVRIGATAHKSIEQHTLDHQIASQQDGARACGKNRTKHLLLSKTPIVCSTLSSCIAGYTKGLRFDYLIVDEACQATELNMLIPLTYNFRKIVLIGDPKQLPPTVFSQDPALEHSLFERLSHAYPPVFLNEQYRMHPKICRVASRLFYDGKLVTAAQLGPRDASARSTAVPDGRVPAHGFDPTNFVHISGGNELIDENKSYYNPLEAAVALRIQSYLIGKYRNTLRINILSPYKAQIAYIRNRKSCECEANTIDAFQGKEADVTILSTVRQSGLGFVCDFRRINVAITRSKRCVIILGNSRCLRASRVWRDIIAMTSGESRFSDRNIENFLHTL